ncbi:MAG: hypothetical protein KAT16_07975 [Candidatus Heimdallarchaeota archaeon]|nr:hypothetical protein [Candidatus Heimdallarchaeota archaeon]
MAEKMYHEITLPFYDNWKHTGYLHHIEAYVKTYNSLLLEIEDIKILIPKRIILFEAIERSSKVFDRLQENLSFEQFRKSLLIISRDLNIPIRKTDNKIIQKLANPSFSKSLDRFPKMAELAYGTRSDIRTVTSRINYLFESHILSIIYTINMAKIGYQTISFLHKIRIKDIPSDLQEYILFNFPAHSTQSNLTVLQYPYSNSAIMLQLNEAFKISPPDCTFLLKQYRGWNFGGLTSDPKERWKLKPPLLELGGNWNQDLILGKIGLVSNLDPFFDPYELSKEEARLLGFIQLHSTMEDASLEKQLTRSRKTIVADWKKLLQNAVIQKFPIFSNLGLGSWVYFSISNLEPSHLRLIHQHFKFFPYSHIFFNELEGIIVGCVNIPFQWTHTFLYQLSSLPEEFPESKTNYYIGPDLLARWGINLMKTFHWKKFN